MALFRVQCPLGGLRTLVPLGRVHCSQSQPVRQEVSLSTHVPLVVSGDHIRGRSRLGRDMQLRRNNLLTEREVSYFFIQWKEVSYVSFLLRVFFCLLSWLSYPAISGACMTWSFPLRLGKKQSNFWKSVSNLTPWRSLSLGNGKLGCDSSCYCLTEREQWGESLPGRLSHQRIAPLPNM